MTLSFATAGTGRFPRACCGLGCLFLILPVLADSPPLRQRWPQAPPPAPPIEVDAAARGKAPTGPRGPLGTMLYSIGEPTDEEQLYLEYINRARANPPAEGQILYSTSNLDVRSAYDFFQVDLALLTNEFNAIAVAQPLSMNAQLTAAARLHSGDMYTNRFQGHTNSWDGKNFDSRVHAQGYDYSTAGENVYSYAESVFHGHAGFEVDWGPGPGGMQVDRGHRRNIHNISFREVGIGVLNGNNDPVGPQLVTQDFAAQNNAQPMITGVAYYDFNGNDFYDPGEGLEGIRVDADGSDFYAVTAASGGYSVPVPGNNTYAVTFSSTNLSPAQVTATVSGNLNLKVDRVIHYAPPVVSGPDVAGVNQTNHYTAPPVELGDRYEWRVLELTDLVNVEGAEGGLTTNLVALVSPGYDVVTGDVQANGSASFHLAHVEPEPQVLELNRLLRPGPAAELTFDSRLGLATVDEVAQVQVTTNAGATWQEVWNQPGTDDQGETDFSSQSVSLGEFAGGTIQIRFVYDFTVGSWFGSADTGVGWYVDDIAFNDTAELSPVADGQTLEPAYDFVPLETGQFEIEVRPQVLGQWLSYGPPKAVEGSAAVLSVQVGSIAAAGTLVQVSFTIQGGVATAFQLETKTEVTADWAPDTGASLETVVADSQYRFTTSTDGEPRRFYRVRAGP